MLSFSQRDPRWATRLIGGSFLTLGRYGCTITCIADLSTYFGDNLTPLQVNKICKFTSGGLVYWASCRFAHFVFDRRAYGRSNLQIHTALKDPDRAVLLQVASASHWCVATGWQKEIADFKIADPWLGDFSNMARYGKDITGAAYFKRI